MAGYRRGLNACRQIHFRPLVEQEVSSRNGHVNGAGNALRCVDRERHDESID